MTDVVVDASAAAAWLIESQATLAAYDLAGEWTDHVGYAPYVFSVELRSLLLSAERRERADEAATQVRMRLLAEFQIAIEQPIPETDLDRIAALARLSGSGYADAHYLDLALHIPAAVATRDRGMAVAGRRLGLTVFDLAPLRVS